MALYLALQIMKGKLDYVAVVKKFGQYKDDIDAILVAEGFGHLIVEIPGGNK